ncbi:hypothetical protein EST38_g11914 [Candolleomyces aberdarensis]|uniref:Uncharacterized protein n=1 Tax=Candolleomyces aberdarensis TaxID=2316362 RepID=A0A4Q2D4E3_9AGAR|nr:hypothetical protein EST38_g11914 [Candolleomyces aberdarensis]
MEWSNHGLALPPQGTEAVNTPPVIESTRYLQIYDRGANDPLYLKFVLGAIFLVLILNIVFNVPQSVCEVVLALGHDQLDGLGGLINKEHLQYLSRLLPKTVKGALAAFDLDPTVRQYLVCPRCYGIVPKEGDYPKSCPHREAPDSPPCNEKLVRTDFRETGRDTDRPIKEYIHQSFPEWLGRFLCRPDVEAILDRRKAEFKEKAQGHSTLVYDILESKAIQEFTWPDGKAFFDCPDDEFRLFFALSGDGFNPFSNKEAKQTVTSTGLYLFCLNLPLEERQKPENVYLAGVIPGPDKPSTSQINHYISLIVDDFLPCWKTGVRYTHTWKRPAGALARTALMPVLADALGIRQLCGYGAVTSQFFCTFCWLPISDLENFDKISWPSRNLDSHRYWAEQWKDADSSSRIKLFREHGLRYTPLLRLPYFNPPLFSIVDTMHNLLTGLLMRHCRNIWGMDLEIEAGEGEFAPGRAIPSQPSSEAMRKARRLVELGDFKAGPPTWQEEEGLD